MTKKKITLDYTNVMQFHAGTTYEVIEHDGVVYWPSFPVAAGGAKAEAADTSKAGADTAEEPAAPKGRRGAAATKETEEAAPKGRRGAAKAEKEEAPEEKPAGRGRRGGAAKEEAKDAQAEVKAIFEELDKGEELTEADAKKQLTALAGKDATAKENYLSAFEKFMKDPNISIDEVLAIAFGEGEEEQEEEKPKGRGGKAAAKKKKAPSVDDLQIGDRVSVKWFATDDYEEGDYEGEVVKAPRGKKGVFIQYDDDDAATLFEPEFHELLEILPAEE